MPAPDASTLQMFRNGPPVTDDTSPVPGTPSFTTPVDGTAGRNQLIAFIPFDAILDKTVYGIGTWRNAASGNLDSARMGLRGGMKPSTSVAAVQIVSTHAADAGRKARLIMKVGSVWLPTPEIMTLAGTTPAFSLNQPDIGKLYRVEALDSAGNPSAPVGNWTISVGGLIVGVMYGTTASAFPTTMTTLEYRIACATARQTALSMTNRLTPPGSGISAFSHATRWTGFDESLSIPGQVLQGGNDWVSFIEERFIPGGAPAPLLGYLDPYPTLYGYPLP